ncbi:MAG: ribonuclease HII [Desulfocucumaceae bacterium]
MDLSAMTVTEIKKQISSLLENPGGPRDNTGDFEELLRAMALDPRAGVINLCRALEKHRLQLSLEEKRLDRLLLYEKKLEAGGIDLIAGVDEAGRGPLAGPVVAAAVIFPPSTRIYELNDSKQLSPVKRKALALQIKKMSKAWAIGVSTVSEILELNIFHASLLAMRRALGGLRLQPGHVLVDGFAIPGLGLPQTHIVGGDGKSASIAAASILAKESRDELMGLCHFLYPQYGFDRHKGYGTAYHLEALRRYGPCRLHREGFGPVREARAAGAGKVTE